MHIGVFAGVQCTRSLDGVALSLLQKYTFPYLRLHARFDLLDKNYTYETLMTPNVQLRLKSMHFSDTYEHSPLMFFSMQKKILGVGKILPDGYVNERVESITFMRIHHNYV